MGLEKERTVIGGMLLFLLLFIATGIGVKFYTDTSTKLAAAFLDTKMKKAALTFDDGPNPEYTEELLDGLKKRGVKASFFLLGEEVEKYPDIVKRISREGHLIGTHSYQHVNLSLLTEEAAAAQISMTNQSICEITGNYPEYVRPPFGSWNENLDDRFDMVEVLWSIDTMDWSVLNADTVVCTVCRQVEDGSVILMHDAYPTSVSAALRIVDMLTKQNYEFVTVDQLILE